ncbi:hypothetical protein ACOSP7_027086 [Xanthoceras sorbifolium]
MANYWSSLVYFLAFFCYLELCSCFNPKNLNLSSHGTHWSIAEATWYGGPNGDGSEEGACGYENAVSQRPFSSLVTAVGPSLYKSGKECGACYQVKCTKNEHPSCSGKGVRVVITDLCPGGPCVSDSAHLDLSGTAFGALALPGQAEKLRTAGVLKIQYARIACDYSEKTIAFHVDQGSNQNYFAVVVEFEEGDGDLAGVDLKEGSADQWKSMQQSWGAVWKLDAGSGLKPPFSIRLTSQYSGQTLLAKNVIPQGWKPGATFRSQVNYL